MMIIKNSIHNKYGFTIVELLVVIVVIGILAAITIVSYTGITAKANIATLNAELANASKKLSMYRAQYDTYPTSIDTSNGCPIAPVADLNYCIKFNAGSTFSYTFKTASTFDLTSDRAGLRYLVTESQSPANIITTPITAVAAISGTNQVSQTLTAGALTPAAATVSYQWQSSATSNGTYTDIDGANSSTYAVSPIVMNKYLRVIARGVGSYVGTVASSSTSTAIASDSNWLIIGSQAWAKTNLNVGTMVAGTITQTNNAVTEKYCYGNVESNCTAYGGLYQWDEAMQYTNVENSRGVCPAGTHIPSDNDWKLLESQLGMTQAQIELLDVWRGTDQGVQLRSGGSSGLTVLIAGLRVLDGSLVNQSLYAYLWSSTEVGGTAWNRVVGQTESKLLRSAIDKRFGYSLRCVGN